MSRHLEEMSPSIKSTESEDPEVISRTSVQIAVSGLMADDSEGSHSK